MRAVFHPSIIPDSRHNRTISQNYKGTYVVSTVKSHDITDSAPVRSVSHRVRDAVTSQMRAKRQKF